MEVQKNNATSPGVRHLVKLKKNLLSKNNNICKFNVTKQIKRTGRSSMTGHITVRRRGGGTKKLHKSIIKKLKSNAFIILAIMYNSNKNSFISFIFNPFTKILFFTQTVNGHSVGTLIESGKFCNSNFPGNVLQLKNILAGSIINSISYKKRYSVFACSAGTYGQIIQKTDTSCKIRLPSGKIKNFSITGYVTLGIVSNTNFSSIILSKAGKSRKLGKRPKVRGVAMNPVDHPHGGRTKGGRPSVSPWGKLTKGVKTKKNV